MLSPFSYSRWCLRLGKLYSARTPTDVLMTKLSMKCLSYKKKLNRLLDITVVMMQMDRCLIKYTVNEFQSGTANLVVKHCTQCLWFVGWLLTESKNHIMRELRDQANVLTELRCQLFILTFRLVKEQLIFREPVSYCTCILGVNFIFDLKFQ